MGIHKLKGDIMIESNKFIKMAENIVRNHYQSHNRGKKVDVDTDSFKEFQDQLVYIVEYENVIYVFSKRVSGYILLVSQRNIEGSIYLNRKEANKILDYIKFLSDCADQGTPKFKNQADVMAWEDEERKVTPRNIVARQG